jgi:tetratricopeptide (TPR) repeat protein
METSDPTNPALSPRESQGLRSLLREHRYAEALAAGQAWLTQSPNEREALLGMAIAQRGLKRIDQALTTLARLEQQHPRFSRLYEERGRCYVELRQAAPAIDAFLRAVNLNYALAGSWSMLEGLYRMTGERENAATAGSHVATMRKVPAEVVAAIALFQDGELDIAESMVRGWLLKNGDHVEAMRLLARIGVARKVYDDPQVLLAAVLEKAPGYRTARQEYAGVLIELHRHQEARAQLERLMQDAPADRALRMQYAAALVGLGEHERAIALYQELLNGTPEDAGVHLSVAHALKTLGRAPQAIEAYRRAAALRPD